MNTTDHALVIGIARYKDEDRFPPLDGPVNDCAGFVQFLQGAGQVPPANIHQVVWDPHNADLQPFRGHIDTALDDLLYSSRGTPRRGRRLYLFAAGHCEAAGATDLNVFTADSTRLAANAFPLHGLADAIRKSALFKQIVVIADGCRDPGDSRALPLFEALPRAPREAVKKVRLMQAYACSYSELAFEKEIDGKVWGLFSYAIIEGLNGAARDRDGKVSTDTLKEYVEARLSELGGDENGQEPEMYCPNDFELL